MSDEQFPVEATHVMMFARSVYDDNPIYFDANYAATTEVGKIIAPPTFVQASAQFDPNYPLRPKVGEAWFGSGATPTGVAKEDKASSGNGGTLHAEQHFEYHRHISPGDVLTASTRAGETWEKQSKRAGTLRFSESITEYRDQSGELVITARGIGVRTEKPVEN